MIYYTTFLHNPQNIKECHNQFALIRKYCLPLLKKKGQVTSELRELQKEYKEFLKLTGALTTKDFDVEQFEIYESCLKSLDMQEKLVMALDDMILKFNDRLKYICEYYDKENLPLHDFCQLINMNEIIARQNSRSEIEEREDRKHYYYLFHGIEDDRSEEGWKSNKSNNMPMFHLIHKAVMIFMDRNKEAKKKMDNYLMHDLGLAKHMLTIKEDENGNKTIEKYYPKLKALT